MKAKNMATYFELKQSIENLLERKKTIKKILLGGAILVFFACLTFLKIRNSEFLASIVGVFILLTVVINSVLALSNFFLFKKVEKLVLLLDEEAQEWKYKEEILKVHISLTQKIKTEGTLISEFIISFCILSITAFSLPLMAFMEGAGIAIIGLPLFCGALFYIFIKNCKEKAFDTLYQRYLMLIEERRLK